LHFVFLFPSSLDAQYCFFFVTHYIEPAESRILFPALFRSAERTLRYEGRAGFTPLKQKKGLATFPKPRRTGVSPVYFNFFNLKSSLSPFPFYFSNYNLLNLSTLKPARLINFFKMPMPSSHHL